MTRLLYMMMTRMYISQEKLMANNITTINSSKFLIILMMHKNP